MDSRKVGRPAPEPSEGRGRPDGERASSPPSPSARRLAWAGAAALVVLVLGVYAPLSSAGFVRIDDPHYVSDNAIVLRGVTWDGLSWAWTTFHASNWHPLTWWSHMLDAELYGARPFGHHLTSVLLHAVAALLVWSSLTRLLGSPARAWVVAALFALHPLHVESVAWVSERKDVLSTGFFALVLWAYGRFARAPGARRMAWVAVFLALGLACKPMLVTAPLVLLLLDVWPLRRERSFGLVLEKWPLFALVAASSVVTFVAQRQWGSVASIESVPLVERLSGAVVACVAYLRLAVWPAGLTVHYPRSSGVNGLELAVALLVLVAVTVLAWRERLRRPYLAWGWAWFLVTLLPVIGLVQVGSQSMADRYTYWPLIGPFVAVVWFVAEALERRRAPRGLAIAAIVAVLVPLSVAAHRRVGDWHDSLTLFQSAVAAEPRSEVARQSLGDELVERGRVDEGIAELRAALEIRPDYEVALNGLGVALQRRGESPAAIDALRRATTIAPAFFEAWFNLGIALHDANDLEGAAHAFERAVSLRPWHFEARANLATSLVELGRLEPARDHARAAAMRAPDTAEDHRRVAAIADAAGDTPLARAELDHVLRLDPADEAACARALTLATEAGDPRRAVELGLQLERIRAAVGARPGEDPR